MTYAQWLLYDDALGSQAKPALERAMKGHILAQGEPVGTYQKMK